MQQPLRELPIAFRVLLKLQRMSDRMALLLAQAETPPQRLLLSEASGIGSIGWSSGEQGVLKVSGTALWNGGGSGGSAQQQV